jgi:hypothetical protein
MKKYGGDEGLLLLLFLVGCCDRYWSIVPASDDRWCWLWSNWWNEDWQGKPKYSEKTCPSATLFTASPTWPDPGSRGEDLDPRILDLGTRWRWVVSFTPPPLLHQENELSVLIGWEAGWAPQRRLVAVEKQKTSCSYREPKPGLPARNLFLCRPMKVNILSFRILRDSRLCVLCICARSVGMRAIRVSVFLCPYVSTREPLKGF